GARKRARKNVENFRDRLPGELHPAGRGVVAARSRDKLLEGRGGGGTELLRLPVGPAKRYGIEVSRVGLRDVILPREVQRVMMQEVEADRAGRADLVKARHELAAARARANTAKVLAETPEIARLREIDAILELAGKSGNVIVLPNLADLLLPRRAEGGK